MSRESFEADPVPEILVDQARLESMALAAPSPVKRIAKRVLYRLFRWYARASLAEQNRVNTVLQERLDRLVREQAETRRQLERMAGRLGLGHYESTFDYMGFENEYRGSEESITERQRAYLDILRDHGPVVDIGCGRGEFLRLLRENQIEGLGVDMNPVAVAYCLEQGLAAVQDDARSFLGKAADASFGGIIMNQVVEHIPFPEIVEIVALAYRKLKDGGCFIVETINPQSLIVYTEAYSLDPSHQRMIHPYTMKYLMRQMAFVDLSLQYSSPVDAAMHLKPIVANLQSDALDDSATDAAEPEALDDSASDAAEPEALEGSAADAAEPGGPEGKEPETESPGQAGPVSGSPADPEALHSYEILNGLVYGHREYAVIGYKRVAQIPGPAPSDSDGQVI